MSCRAHLSYSGGVSVAHDSRFSAGFVKQFVEHQNLSRTETFFEEAEAPSHSPFSPGDAQPAAELKGDRVGAEDGQSAGGDTGSHPASSSTQRPLPRPAN